MPARDKAKPSAAPAKPIEFEAWLDVAPRMMKKTPKERAKILEDVGLAPSVWSVSDDRWSEVLADDILNDRRERPTQYAKRCAAEMRQRAEAAKAPPVVDEPPAKAEPPAEIAPEPQAPPIDRSPIESPWARPKVKAHAPALSKTVDIEAAMAEAKASSPLPFAPSPAGDVLPKAAKEAPAPKPEPGKRSNRETVDIEAAVREAKAALPFEQPPSSAPAAPPKAPSPAQPAAPPKAPPPAPPAAPSSAPAKAAPPPVPKRRSANAGTVDIAKALAEVNAPAKTGGPDPYGGLTLEQYAALSAQLHVHPQRALEIAKRYGIADEHALHALHEAWNMRLARDRPTWQRWHDMKTQYQEWYRKQGEP